MMSKKCKYAIKALMRLAKNFNQGHLQTADIAQKENIPKKFLEQILLDLKHAEIVSSKQGSGGGYFLIKDPKDVSIAEIYRLFDGAIALLPCVSLNFYEKCDDCTNESECAMQREFIKIREGARVVMSQTTIASLLN
jgi:Rrf2 family protein